MSDPSPQPACCAIIVAAGASRRMGFDKLSCGLAGVPVLRRTVESFLRTACIRCIVIVCPEERWRLLDGMAFTKPVWRVDGGQERQNSVMNGLAIVPYDCPFVAVHDGARPLVSPDDIKACVAGAALHGAAALAKRITDTIKRSDDAACCLSSVDRDNLWSMETPQVFKIDLLRLAYQNVISSGLSVTDEVSAVHATGTPVKFIESMHPNLKITTPSDLALAEALWKLWA
jgi:2-C-methyl-D-erythritol 4-phosphate cytidylyltransferase